MLQNEYLVAKIGVDTAENEPSEVCRYQHTAPRLGHKYRSVKIKSLETTKIKKKLKTLKGSFFSVSKPIFTSKYAFCSIFRDLQDSKTFAPLQTQNFAKFWR